MPAPAGLTGHPVRPAAHRILLVDDHPVVLDGMAALLGSVPGFEVVGTASERSVAVALAHELRPNVVVLDLRMQGTYAPEVVVALKAAVPGVLVLVHTATEESAPVRAALDAGADGAVFKDARDLVPALQALLAGERLPVDRRLLDGGLPEPLSPREYAVLRAYAAGRSTAQVAAELFLAESTVRSYTKTMLVKLGAHSRVEAVAMARTLGLL